MIFIKKKRRRKRGLISNVISSFFLVEKRPMNRYVYLMERVTNREWKTLKQFKREVKIGVAKNAQERHETVDDGIPGKVVILDQFWTKEATKVESELHRIYKAYRFKIKGAKKGSGSTEFFRLTDRQVRQIRKKLRSKTTNPFERYWWFFVFIVPTAFVIIIHQFK